MSDVVFREVASPIGKAVSEAIPILTAAVAKHPMFATSVIAVGIVFSAVAMNRWGLLES